MMGCGESAVQPKPEHGRTASQIRTSTGSNSSSSASNSPVGRAVCPFNIGYSSAIHSRQRTSFKECAGAGAGALTLVEPVLTLCSRAFASPVGLKIGAGAMALAL